MRVLPNSPLMAYGSENLSSIVTLNQLAEHPAEPQFQGVSEIIDQQDFIDSPSATAPPSVTRFTF